MATFDLVTEAWIPCVALDGSFSELGLHEVLARAQEIRELYDPSPLTTMALHRLLLAILHRNFGPASFDAWKPLWTTGHWDEDRLSQYFEQWRDEFDLFRQDRPFYQVPEMDTERLPVARLAQEVASGNNPTLFDHSIDDTPAPVTAAAAARLVVATQAFAVGGGVSKPFNLSDAPLTRGLCVLAVGDTLFETLALNLVPYSDRTPMVGGPDDAPIWEQNRARAPDKQGTIPRGYLDYLTWQSRRIHLVPEGDPPTVTWCQVQQHFKLAPDVRDPMQQFKRDKKEGFLRLRFQAERAMWRDSHTLLLEETGDTASQRPAVFNHLALIAEARDEGLVASPQYGISALGLGTAPGQARVDFWRHERLPLPLSYLAEKELRDALRTALDLSEAVAQALRSGVRELARLALSPLADQPSGRQPRWKEDIAPLMNGLGAERSYWASLDRGFTELFVGLPADRIEADGLATYGATSEMERWRNALRRTARDAFQSATTAFDMNARTLKAVAEAERLFAWRLRRALEATPGDDSNV